jgi:hypothetical protein
LSHRHVGPNHRPLLFSSFLLLWVTHVVGGEAALHHTTPMAVTPTVLAAMDACHIARNRLSPSISRQTLAGHPINRTPSLLSLFRRPSGKSSPKSAALTTQ